MAAKALSIPTAVPTSAPAPQSSSSRKPPSSPPEYKALLRHATNAHERRALHLVYFCTIGANPPTKCASTDTIIETLDIKAGFDVKLAIAALDRRHVLRWIDEGGEYWVSIRPAAIRPQQQSAESPATSEIPQVIREAQS